jgi:hypothetical protein
VSTCPRRRQRLKAPSPITVKPASSAAVICESRGRVVWPYVRYVTRTTWRPQWDCWTD